MNVVYVQEKLRKWHIFHVTEMTLRKWQLYYQSLHLTCSLFKNAAGLNNLRDNHMIKFWQKKSDKLFILMVPCHYRNWQRNGNDSNGNDIFIFLLIFHAKYEKKYLNIVHYTYVYLYSSFWYINCTHKEYRGSWKWCYGNDT